MYRCGHERRNIVSKFRTLLLAHHIADNHAIRRAVSQFSENVARRTEGQIAIATVPNSSLGHIPELQRMVMDGAADMVFLPYDRLGVREQKFGCVALPFVFDDHAHADRVLNGEFKAWALPDLEVLGLDFLGTWEWGFRQITSSRHRILKPEDLRGLKIRVPPIQPYLATLLAFGAIPVMVEYSQIINVINQGLIDGQENPVAVIHSLGLYNTQKFLSLVNYSYGILGHVISRRCLESLEEDQKSILREESVKAGQLIRQLVRAQETEQLEDLALRGVHIDRPDVAPFKAMMEPVYKQLYEVYGEENILAFLAMAERGRVVSSGGIK